MYHRSLPGKCERAPRCGSSFSFSRYDAVRFWRPCGHGVAECGLSEGQHLHGAVRFSLESHGVWCGSGVFRPREHGLARRRSTTCFKPWVRLYDGTALCTLTKSRETP